MSSKPQATPSASECVRVMVRARPMNDKELNQGIFFSQ